MALERCAQPGEAQERHCLGARQPSPPFLAVLLLSYAGLSSHVGKD